MNRGKSSREKSILFLGPPPRPDISPPGVAWVPFITVSSATVDSWKFQKVLRKCLLVYRKDTNDSLGFTVWVPEIYKNLQKRLDR